MKKVFVLIVAIIICYQLNAQTVNPSCYSNAKAWKITSVQNSYDGTYVTLSYYGYQSNYEFSISADMYIEKCNAYSTKYRILSFVDNELNAKYTLNPYTQYKFTLKFEKIPDDWTDINIAEPFSQSYNSWYWNYISLNKSPTERLKMDNFLLDKGMDFLKNFAHLTNDFRTYTYNIDYDAINVTLYYQGYVTDLRIKFDGILVSNISIIYDNDWVDPFALLTLLRDWIFKNDSNQKYSSEFERIFAKRIMNMTGRELACVALTILWNAN